MPCGQNWLCTKGSLILYMEFIHKNIAKKIDMPQPGLEPRVSGLPVWYANHYTTGFVVFAN
jgi:hypothetical protein